MAYQKLKQSLTTFTDDSSPRETSLEETELTEKIPEQKGFHDIEFEGSFITSTHAIRKALWIWKLATGLCTTLLVFFLLQVYRLSTVSKNLVRPVALGVYNTILFPDRNGNLIKYQSELVPKIFC
jgi:hypothetical protein